MIRIKGILTDKPMKGHRRISQQICYHHKERSNYFKKKAQNLFYVVLRIVSRNFFLPNGFLNEYSNCKVYRFFHHYKFIALTIRNPYQLIAYLSVV